MKVVVKVAERVVVVKVADVNVPLHVATVQNVVQAVPILPAAAMHPLVRTIAETATETVTIAEIATETTMTDAAPAALPTVIAIGIVT